LSFFPKQPSTAVKRSLLNAAFSGHYTTPQKSKERLCDQSKQAIGSLHDQSIKIHQSINP
jgi:hypothetical protein